MKSRSSKPSLHQVTVGSMPGDAITDHALMLRGWFREMGFHSEIYAQFINPALRDEIHPIGEYKPGSAEPYLIYHHSIGSSVPDHLMALSPSLILIYHNITPQAFFEPVAPELARELAEGRRQLAALRARTELAVAVSPFNEKDLCAAGFTRTRVIPIALDEEKYALPINEALVARYGAGGTRLVYIGRLVPNKKQEDLIKLLYFYKRIDPAAQLLLVGDPWIPAYAQSLRELAVRLGLCDSVFLVGHVSQADMVTFFRLADVFVSMSEHEGFGKPLIESMYLGLPVMAFASSAVPETMGEAGVLFYQKDYALLAELVDVLVHDPSLRQRIIATQRKRAQTFLKDQIRQSWVQTLESLFAEP